MPIETLAAADERGTAKLDTSGWDPGAYDAVLTDGDDAEVARVSFYLRDPQARLELSTDRRSYGRGEPIEVSWAQAPANRWDWLGVYKASASDPAEDDYLIWAYAGRTFGGHRPADHRRRGRRSAPTARAPRGRCRRATTSSTTCSPTSTSRPAAPSSAFARGRRATQRDRRGQGLSTNGRKPAHCAPGAGSGCDAACSYSASGVESR